MQAMIFAAGLGTRLKPLTDTMPKALVRVGGVPLIDIVVRRLMGQGCRRFVVNVHHFAQQVIDHVQAQDYAPLVRFSDEREQLLETGGGLKKAAPLFSADEPVLIHNVDILSNVDFRWFLRQHTKDADAVLLVSRRKTKRYLIFDEGMRLVGWTNVETGEVRGSAVANSTLYTLHSTLKRKLKLFAFSGIHSFSPGLFPMMEEFPERFPIIDFYLSVCDRRRIVGCVKEDLEMVDVGKLETVNKAEEFFTRMEFYKRE